MSEAVIIKRKVNKNFTVLPNEVIHDDSLTWGGLGLLSYILSLPENFKLRLSDLANRKLCGREATRARLRELEATGYLVIRRVRGEAGRFTSTLWEVTDTPDFTGQQPRSGFPNTVEPNLVEPKLVRPSPEDPTLINTDTKQKLSEQKTTTTKAADEQPSSTHPVLRYPRSLSAADQAAVSSALSDTPTQEAQALLDELSAAIAQTGVIRTTPIRWFFGLLKRYHNGQFAPTAKRSVDYQQKVSQVPVTSKAAAPSNIGAAHLRLLKRGRSRSGGPNT